MTRSNSDNPFLGKRELHECPLTGDTLDFL
jgi:hypothetical protein